MYLWPGAQSMIGMSSRFGVMTTASHNCVPVGIREGRWWASDNEVFADKFDDRRFFGHLKRLADWQARCLFVVAPDVVGDAAATLARYREYAHRCRHYGPVAFVAQDGQESLSLPVAFDWLFIGGSTEWKLSDAAAWCITEAHRLGKRVHVGRVNSLKRMHHFETLGVESVDGTFPCKEPDTARRRLTRGLNRQRCLYLPVPDSDSAG